MAQNDWVLVIPVFFKPSYSYCWPELVFLEQFRELELPSSNYEKVKHKTQIPVPS